MVTVRNPASPDPIARNFLFCPRLRSGNLLDVNAEPENRPATQEVIDWPADPPEPPFNLRRDFFLVIRYTRNWLHYGFMVMIFVCVFIGAVKGLLAQIR